MKHPDPRIEALLSSFASPKLAAIDLSLDRVRALLEALGNPQDRLPPVVHVAGTNGKGSLLAYLAAILKAAGYKAHRYISPHLVRFNERILLAGEEIDDGRLLKLLERVAAHMDRHPVTFFEATTAAAFLAFSENPADILLLETGLGGRLDATNLVRAPLLTAITPISMDHMEFLGSTLEAIATEKAGIIKQGVPCVVGPQVPEVARVIAQAAGTLGAPLFPFDDGYECVERDSGFHYKSSTLDAPFPWPSLAGDHQMFNAGTAIACVEQLRGFKIKPEHIREGITHAVWPARLQRLTSGSLASLMPPGGELWLDGGHNPGAGEALAKWAKAQEKPVHLICGMLKTKDTHQFLLSLAAYAKSLSAVPIADEPQSQTPEAIGQAAKDAGIAVTYVFSLRNDIKHVIESIVKKEKSDFIILICGSLYLAGYILCQNNKTA